MGAAEWGVGCQVSGVTPLGEKFSGEVFSYDDAMGLAVLRTKGDIINTHDVRILRVEGVQDLKSTPPATAPVLDPLPLVDEARCQKREEASIKAAQASAGECCESIRSDLFFFLWGGFECPKKIGNRHHHPKTQGFVS